MSPEAPLIPIDYGARLAATRAVLAARRAEGGPSRFLLSDPISLRWCTGFAGSSGWLLLGLDLAVFVTDPRYGERTQSEFAERGLGAEVEILVATGRSEMDALLWARGAGPGPLGFCPNSTSHARWSEISTHLEVAPAFDPTTDLRRAKDAAEVARIERACAIADAALADTWSLFSGPRWPTEFDVRTEIEYRMRCLGADGPSYDTIVACGPEHAARPHHEVTRRPMRDGETLIIDVGALVDGYHSDMTRSVVLGGPSPEQERIYAVVAEAQSAALEMAGPGVSAAALDAACRRVVAEHGLSDWYLHSTGHGVGLQIHEDPFAAPTSAAVLRVGDVVTVEPGLYRAGFGGLRIEDLILITETGHRILTHTPKDRPCLPSPPTT